MGVCINKSPWNWHTTHLWNSLGHWMLIYDCFHTTAKCVFWIVIWDAHLESRFEIRYFGPCVRQITSRFVIWDAHLNSRSKGVFELRISNHESRRDLANTRSKIPYFESWFKMRISNHDSKYALCRRVKTVYVSEERHEIYNTEWRLFQWAIVDSKTIHSHRLSITTVSQILPFLKKISLEEFFFSLIEKLLGDKGSN